MSNQGTSTIVQYVRDIGDASQPHGAVIAYAVQHSWHRGKFVETARWRVPYSQLRRETVPGLPPGPLGYGRADLIAGGAVKPAGHSFEHLPYLSLVP